MKDKYGYRSELDTFLQDEFAKRVNPPESVQKEIEKHQKIAYKRDNPVDERLPMDWEEF